jgi:hypothetical protein
MSTNNSAPPPKTARRVVLRKIVTPERQSPSAEPDGTTSSFDRATAWVGEAPSAPPPLWPRDDASSSESLAPLPSRSSARSKPPTTPWTKSSPLPPLAADSSRPAVAPADSSRPAPGALIAPAAPPSMASAPSLDSSPGRTPPPSRARVSEVPVVANVEGEAQAPRAPAATASTSARKAGLIGAGVGLAFVVLFVLGARLAYRVAPQDHDTKSSASTAPAPSREMAAPTSIATAASIAADTLSAGAPAAPPMAVPTQILAPVAREQARRGAPRPVGAGAGTAGPPKAAKPAADSPLEPSSPPTMAASSSAAAGGGQAETAESAESLIPVIPSSPPPELDPLVKAVLEEDEPRRK